MASAYNLENLQDLTIILPTIGMERRHFAAAAVHQWAATKAHIVVSDGSAESHSRVFQQFDTVTYLQDAGAYQRRLANAAKHVRTEFSMIMSDDDVFVPSIIAACIEAMKQASDYAAVAPLLAESNGKRYTIPRNSLDWKNSSSTRTSRLAYLSENIAPSCIYAVSQSDLFKRSLDWAARNSLPAQGSHQHHHEIFMNALGKVRILPQIGWLRRTFIPKVNRRDPSIVRGWLEDPKDELRQSFVNGLSAAIAEASGGPEKQIRDEVEALVANYAFWKTLPLTRKLEKKVGSFGSILDAALPTRLSPISQKVQRRVARQTMYRKRNEPRGVVLPKDAFIALQHREDLEACLRTVFGGHLKE